MLSASSILVITAIAIFILRYIEEMIVFTFFITFIFISINEVSITIEKFAIGSI